MSKPITTNRKAHRDYHILESIECGIELKGSEVKSLRDGKMNLDDSFARIDPQGVTLYNSHISPYAQASYLNVDPERPRRLLLHHSQIERLLGNSTQKGLTLIPLKAYFNDRGLAKIELALCKGKRLYDKRQDLRRRDADLEIRRALKGKRK
ncbi:MAG: SsrA-binding protein SmpB [Candidatus Omnitrophica bacterium]|nr:SsrA-binding protein SmpB [Candidatus Omnitrophota bacterium]